MNQILEQHKISAEVLVVSTTVVWGGLLCLQPHVQKPLIVSLGLSITEERAAPGIAPHYPMALSLAQPAPVESASHFKGEVICSYAEWDQTLLQS